MHCVTTSDRLDSESPPRKRRHVEVPVTVRDDGTPFRIDRTLVESELAEPDPVADEVRVTPPSPDHLAHQVI